MIRQVLLEAGADINIRNSQKLRPIDLSRMRSVSPGDQWGQISKMLGCVVQGFQQSTNDKL